MTMASCCKPYPISKSSGVEWLGDVPAHWEIARLGAVLRERGEQNLNGSITEVLSVLNNRGVIPYSQKGNIGNKKSDDITRYKVVRAGDIVVNSMNVIIGSVGLSPYDGCLSPVYYVLTSRSDQDDIRYLDAYFQTKPFQQSLIRIGNGILAHRMRIPMQLLKSEPFPRPSLKEQRAIVRFLDHADRRIQRYIRAKERLIELLEEQKQAIIHQAVTGQIDVRTGEPYPAYKDSGVEWLGDVPEHWEVRRLKYAVSFTGGGTPSKANASFWSGHVPWVSPKDMTRSRLYDTTDHISDEAVAASAASIVEPGAVLMVVRSGILRRTIPVAINMVSMALNQDMKALCPRRETIKDKYLCLLIQGNRSVLLREWRKQGATVESIEHGLLANSLVPIPPLQEQNAIARFLESADRRISTCYMAVNQEINLLREYRTRLIADIVTGKLDVREAAASLPETDPLTAADPSDNPATQVTTEDEIPNPPHPHP